MLTNYNERSEQLNKIEGGSALNVQTMELKKGLVYVNFVERGKGSRLI